MSTSTKKFLLVFNLRDLETFSLNQKIQKYHEIMLRLQKFERIAVEWHVIYVAPQFPCYALNTASISQIQDVEIRRGKKVLASLGQVLDIPKAQQHLCSGNADIQAWILSKHLSAQKVFGYSATFTKFMNFNRKIKSLLERARLPVFEAFSFKH